jgi:hypothetical protein
MRRCFMLRGLNAISLSFLFVIASGVYTCLPAADEKGATIKPSGILEDCLEMMPGQEVDYSFEASGPIDFNIHSHEKSGVVHEISKEGVSADKGTFCCTRTQYYCFMWTNPGTVPVSVRYHYSLGTKEQGGER